jgi:hypothetical protein
MAGKRTRRRRGHPRGKAYGFHGLRPASTQQSTKSSDTGGTGGSQTSGTSSSSTSNTSSGS